MNLKTQNVPQWLRITALGGFLAFGMTSAIILKGGSSEPLAPAQAPNSDVGMGVELEAGPADRPVRIAQGEPGLPAQPAHAWVDLGAVHVLDGIPLRALPNQDLDLERAHSAMQEIQLLSRKLGRKVLRERPQLQGEFLELQEAEDLSLMGGIVLRARHPENPVEEVYFPCPTDCSDVIAEIQTIYQAVQNQPVVMDSLLENALSGLDADHPDERLTTWIRPDGTGIDVRNGSGETLRWSFFNVPGQVLTMNPR